MYSISAMVTIVSVHSGASTPKTLLLGNTAHDRRRVPLVAGLRIDQPCPGLSKRCLASSISYQVGFICRGHQNLGSLLDGGWGKAVGCVPVLRDRTGR